MGEAQNPYAPPLAEVKDAPQSGTERAGRGSRLLAVIVDIIIQVLVLWVLSFILPWQLFGTAPSFGLLVMNGLLGGVVFLAVQGTLLMKHGQTIGKKALGLRIVRTDGSAVSAGRVLGLRYGIGLLVGVIPVINMIYGLIDCLLIFRESRQCLHDQIADTIVVRA